MVFSILIRNNLCYTNKGDFMKKLSLILGLSLLLVGCQTNKPNTSSFSNITVSAGFDTYFSLRVETTSQEQFTEYFEQSVDSFTNFNELFDIYHTYPDINNLKTINDSAGISEVEVDPALIDLLLMSKEFYDLSNGEFDITLGSVLQVWHKYRELNDGSLPTADELDASLACTGWEYVEINEDKNTVFITNPCVSLDVGGIAKGFATEQIAQDLISEDIVMGVVDAGGNNRTIHDKLDGSPWRVGIQNPGGSGSILIVSRTGSSSFVTSGDYQRFFVGEDDIKYHHIIDPKTAYPANYFRSVTVVTEDSAVADVFSTLLFTNSYEDGLKIIQSYNESFPEKPVSAIWVLDKDKKAEISSSTFIELDNYICLYTEDLTEHIDIVK